MQQCTPTQTPEIDHEALRAKYLAERDKRLRPEGQNQYLTTEEGFEAFYEGDPYTEVVPREPVTDETVVVVLGGGFSGLVTAARLVQDGISDFRVIELGGDFGGAWYWNRYPGIQCDTDCYCYLPLLEETGYVPVQKYSFGAECFEHAQRIGRHFGLYDKALFHTLVESLTWDEDIDRWHLRTNRGDEIRARFVIMCQGPFNKPKLPGIEGIDSFRGHTFHTARWDYDYTGGDATGAPMHRLADKKVAIIGTGASGIQAVPHLARAAGQLYVFQRTPSYIDERGNVPTDPEWARTLQPGWQAERRRNFHTAAFEAFAPGQPDLVCDGWTEVARNLAAHLDETAGWATLTPEKFMELRELQDYRAMQRIRDRVDAVVDDPATAEALKPWYRFLCKRPCFNDEYLPTFNRPNVTLVDVSATRGVERITEKGIVQDGVEYDVDVIIFASGFEITTDLDRRFGIAPFAGVGGESLYEHWAGGYRTLHGITAHGFPNLFFEGFVQGGVTASTTHMFEQQANHIAYILTEALERGVTRVEPTPDAVEQWCTTVRETAVDNSNFERECTPGYYNSEGEKRHRSHLGDPYWPGFHAMEDVLEAWRETGKLEGLVLDQ